MLHLLLAVAILPDAFNLTSDNFVARQEAERRAGAFGLPALPAIYLIRFITDLEGRKRAGRITRKVEGLPGYYATRWLIAGSPFVPVWAEGIAALPVFWAYTNPEYEHSGWDTTCLAVSSTLHLKMVGVARWARVVGSDEIMQIEFYDTKPGRVGWLYVVRTRLRGW